MNKGLTLCVGLLVGFFVGGFHPDIIVGGGVGFHIMLGGDAFSDLEEEHGPIEMK